MSEKLRVLAVGAHPDDVEINCGGTLALYAQAGHHVMIAHATNGEKGHRTIPPAALAEIRKAEAQAAADVIGAELFWMGFPDGDLFYDRETRLHFVDMIRAAHPDIILTHWGETYHPDHIATSQLVCGASYLSTVPHFKTEHDAADVVPKIYYMDVYFGVDAEAAEYVDITPVHEQKRQMLSAHKSQIEWLQANHGVDVVERMIDQDRALGQQLGTGVSHGGATYGERFVPRGFRAGKRLLP